MNIFFGLLPIIYGVLFLVSFKIVYKSWEKMTEVYLVIFKCDEKRMAHYEAAVHFRIMTMFASMLASIFWPVTLNVYLFLKIYYRVKGKV